MTLAIFALALALAALAWHHSTWRRVNARLALARVSDEWCARRPPVRLAACCQNDNIVTPRETLPAPVAACDALADAAGLFEECGYAAGAGAADVAIVYVRRARASLAASAHLFRRGAERHEIEAARAFDAIVGAAIDAELGVDRNPAAAPLALAA